MTDSTTFAQTDQPKTTSAWTYGLISGVLASGLLLFGLKLTASAESAMAIGPVYFIPALLIIVLASTFIFRTSREGNAFNRLLKGVLLIAVVTGLMAGFAHTAWYRWVSPEIVEEKLKMIAQQMLDDGYADADIAESVNRMRVAFTGYMGAFISGLMWMMAGGFPAIFIVFLSRRS